VLRDKAKRYDEILPHSSLRDYHPLVILAAPTARRARSASTAIANTAAPLSVTVWNRETRRSLLATVTHCAPDARSHSPQSERANLVEQPGTLARDVGVQVQAELVDQVEPHERPPES
jgi:hypothetical protein